MITIFFDENGWCLSDGYQAMFPDAKDEAVAARDLAASLIAAAKQIESKHNQKRHEKAQGRSRKN